MKVVQTILLIVISITCQLTYADKLTVNSVQELLDTVESAIKKKNINKLEGTIADNFELTVVWDIEGKERTDKFNKESYINMILDVWKNHSEYQYKQISSDIYIKSNIKALVVAVVNESTIHEGKRIHWSTKEEVTIELVADKLLTTGIKANSRM